MKSRLSRVVGISFFALTLAVAASVQVKSDQAPAGDLSIETINRQLRAMGGSGWDQLGPGGSCTPSEMVNCFDAVTIQTLVKELLSAMSGEEISDPAMIEMIERIQGAKSERRSAYLSFSLFLDGSFTYEFPADSSGQNPLRSITFPETVRLNLFSNGEKGTVTLKKPSRNWRLSSLKIRTAMAPMELYLEEATANLLNSTLTLKVGIWDAVSVWAKGSFTDLQIKVDYKRSLLENLKLFVLIWPVF